MGKEKTEKKQRGPMDRYTHKETVEKKTFTGGLLALAKSFVLRSPPEAKEKKAAAVPAPALTPSGSKRNTDCLSPQSAEKDTKKGKGELSHLHPSDIDSGDKPTDCGRNIEAELLNCDNLTIGDASGIPNDIIIPPGQQ